MDLIGMNVPGGTAGVLGYIVAAITGALMFVRWAYRKDRVEGAQTKAEIDIIARLSAQLDKANERVDLAEKRADDAYRERNEAYQMVGKLESKIGALEAQVKMLREKLDGKAT